MIDLTNKKYGKLTVIKLTGEREKKEDYMQCEVHDKSGTHCQNNVIHKFQFNGKEVYLCSKCFANVCSGAYGIDLQLSAVASHRFQPD